MIICLRSRGKGKENLWKFQVPLWMISLTFNWESTKVRGPNKTDLRGTSRVSIHGSDQLHWRTIPNNPFWKFRTTQWLIKIYFSRIYWFLLFATTNKSLVIAKIFQWLLIIIKNLQVGIWRTWNLKNHIYWRFTDYYEWICHGEGYKSLTHIYSTIAPSGNRIQMIWFKSWYLKEYRVILM